MIDFIMSRKSVPISQIGLPAPSDAEIETMIQAAIRVPDHGRLTPWRFILYRGDNRNRAGAVLADLAERQEGPLPDQRREKELQRFARAPIVIGVVCSPKPHDTIPEWEQFLSAGAAAMNLVMAANALGFATNWITNWYASDAEGRRLLGLAPDERVAGFVHIGTFAGTVPERPRPEPAELLSEYNGPWEES